MLAEKAEKETTPVVPENIELRKPDTGDGSRVHALVKQCSPLDENSTYCNLLQCTHFADTCVVAEENGEIVGFISAYIPPKQPNVLFIWQVAVHDSARGHGLAQRMLTELLERDICEDVQFIEATITPENDASWRMFSNFAHKRGWKAEQFILFDSRIHFAGEHKDEHLLRIGPFNRDQVEEVLGH